MYLTKDLYAKYITNFNNEKINNSTEKMGVTKDMWRHFTKKIYGWQKRA